MDYNNFKPFGTVAIVFLAIGVSAFSLFSSAGDVLETLMASNIALALFY
jgi:hypothetical protein